VVQFFEHVGVLIACSHCKGANSAIPSNEVYGLAIVEIPIPSSN